MELINLWQIWCIAGVLFCITEMFTPAMLFLNLGFACFVAAIAAAFGLATIWQVGIFGICSAIFLIWLRPYLLKQKNSGEPETIEMYIGKTAKVIEKITKNSGKIAIFGEEWQAKSINDEEFETNTQVKIVKNDSIIMYVEKA